MADAAAGPMRIAEIVAAARAAGVERLDAQLLVAHRLGRSRAWLIAHDDETPEPAAAADIAALIARRAAGEPLAYLVGEREFHGLTLSVGPGVLVPRPDTEVLVDWALELLDGALADRPSPAVADLGTGSGAIAIALAKRCRRARVAAVERSDAALAIARRNGEQLDAPVQWLAGDWWAPLAGRRLDLVVSNPPYIAEGDPHLPALRHEPTEALVAGADGLDAIRAIVAGAPAGLRSGGWLLFEHGWDQADAVAALLRAAGFAAVESRRDLAGHLRCTGGRWPGDTARQDPPQAPTGTSTDNPG